jgi:two-component system, OmpR family, response regulator
MSSPHFASVSGSPGVESERREPAYGPRDQRIAEISPRRVLLAEDDEGARRIMAASLRALDLEVVELKDGGRLLVALAAQFKTEHGPDIALVVTDLRMPVLDGLQVIKGLRAAHWRIPVIVVTAHDSDDVRDNVAMLGAVFLPKPLDLELFERTVDELLSRSLPPSSRHGW